MRYESHKLVGLSPEDIVCTFSNLEKGNLVSEVYRLTGGLPRLVEDLDRRIREQGIVDIDGLHAIRNDYYHDDVSSIVRYLPENIREIVKGLALLRRFDFKVFKEIVPTIWPEQYAEYTAYEYLDLIEDLGCWLDLQPHSGYTVNAAYRKVLQGYVKHTDIAFYKKIHKAAFDLYHDMLQQQYQHQYMVEMLYHHLILTLLSHGFDNAAQAKGSISPEEFVSGANGSIMAQVEDNNLEPLYRALIQDLDVALCFDKYDVRQILKLLDKRSEMVLAALFKTDDIQVVK
jgi:hypothetical protein